MKTKIALGLLAAYGVIVATAYHVHSEQVYESSLFLFNVIVEKYIIPPILIFFSNQVGSPIIGNNLLALRILVSIAFWVGIPGGLFLLMKSGKRK